MNINDYYHKTEPAVPKEPVPGRVYQATRNYNLTDPPLYMGARVAGINVLVSLENGLSWVSPSFGPDGKPYWTAEECAWALGGQNASYNGWIDVTDEYHIDVT